MRNLVLTVLVSSCLISCSSLTGSKNEGPVAHPTHSTESATTRPHKGTQTAETTKGPITVNPSDVELGDKMTKAMDNFVFKNKETEFKKLCKDTRFDCLVDGAKFPKNKKTVKRKVPAFLSGSKMGFKGEKRVHVQYDFFPN